MLAVQVLRRRHVSPPGWKALWGLKLSCMNYVARPGETDSEDSPTKGYGPKKVHVNFIDGSNDPKWSSRDFPWTDSLEANNRNVFGNHSFRPGQREVINATMSGHDVLALMPRGGGKSLTYQLPASICRGIALVISPLISRIQYQIMHLSQANIAATCLSANYCNKKTLQNLASKRKKNWSTRFQWAEQGKILSELYSDDCKYKLLYATPEKVSKSNTLLELLESLYSRQMLARIVIDEAHCISQWGHDFRPDYQGLGILKQKFPDIPVLVLTATATASVKKDVVKTLGLVNCIVFQQSFNGPNSWFSVVPKRIICVEDISKYIEGIFLGESVIYFCFPSFVCEDVAEKLKEFRHEADFYHGDFSPAGHASVLNKWSKGGIKIICATGAFGMGIDKRDVRFVFHHTLPTSIEDYKQHMISQEGAAEQSYENLRRMVSSAENDVEYRRVLQLGQLKEEFDSATCKGTCDNCLMNKSLVEKDVTEIAKQLIEVVKSTGEIFPSSHILLVYRGSSSKAVKKHGHHMLKLHGAGKALSKVEATRILRHLVAEGFLVDFVYGLKVNESKAYGLCTGGQTIKLSYDLNDVIKAHP